MIRVGLTQRVETVEAYEERRDCLDQRWGPLMESYGVLPVPLFNRTDDVEAYVRRLNLDGVVLTGGNDLEDAEGATDMAPERDRFERALLDVAIDRRLPVVGVCRGLQLINVYCGGSVRSIEGHVAVRHDLDIDVGRALLADIPDHVTVNSYHRFGVPADAVGDDLAVVGRAPDGTVEWAEHRNHPITGVMWHPERDSPTASLDERIIMARLRTGSS